MKIILELFGASRDFSQKDYLEFEIKNHVSVKDFKEVLLNFIDKKFKGNVEFKKIIESSAFCSEKNEIISDNYKIQKEQKIGIIPPIGGG
jgi:molybdopterin converting factor small subunit